MLNEWESRSGLLGMTGLTHLGQDVGQFLTLSLATNVRSQTGFAELQRSLVLGDLQQLHATLLVRSVADDLTDQIPDEFGVLGLDLEYILKKYYQTEIREIKNFIIFNQISAVFPNQFTNKDGVAYQFNAKRILASFLIATCLAFGVCEWIFGFHHV